METGIFAVLAGFRLIDKAVVMIDNAAINLTGIHRFHHRAVALVGHKIGFHRFKPRQGGLLAFQRQHRADDGLEIRAGWRSGPAPFPLRLRQIHQGCRQLRFADFRRVIDEYGAAGGNAYPAAVLRAVLRGDLLKGLGRQRRKQLRVIHQHHRRRVFGQKDIRRGCRPLLHQLITQLAVAAVTQRHFNSRLFGKAVNPGLHQIFMLRVVDHNPVAAGRRQRLRGNKRGRSHQCSGAIRHQTKTHKLILNRGGRRVTGRRPARIKSQRNVNDNANNYHLMKKVKCTERGRIRARKML